MAEDIKATARRTWEEIFPACDVEALAEVVASDVVAHGARPDEPPGFEGVKRTMLWLGQVFSDQRWEIHQVIGEGDTAVVHATHHARHTGELTHPADESRGLVRLRSHPQVPGRQGSRTLGRSRRHDADASARRASGTTDIRCSGSLTLATKGP